MNVKKNKKQMKYNKKSNKMIVKGKQTIKLKKNQKKIMTTVKTFLEI